MFSIRESRSDRIFNMICNSLLFIALVVAAYPLYFVIIASFSDPSRVSFGEVWLYPKGFTLDGYIRIMEEEQIWRGYLNTLIYTVVGTLINVALTLTSAYALSRKDLIGRNMFMYFIVFTMFFSGGLIPTYLLVKGIGLYDTFWVMVIPGAVSAWNLIIARTFFQNSIPNEVWEAGRMDGCSNLRFFFSIVLPLSQAITAVMILFYAVSHWNEFFSGLIYLRDRSMFPLQLILREILVQTNLSVDMLTDSGAEEKALLANQMRYGVIIIASLPVLILYPFVQKYFVRGVMLGAIKG
jgi:putative aldouronate transport system permease protein